MRKLKQATLDILLSLAIIGTLTLASCSKPTATPPIPTQPPVETALPTALPTVPTERLLLVDPASSATDELQNYLSTFASENGMIFETSDQAELSAQTAQTKIVVDLSAPANIKEIAGGSPDTQFVVSGSLDPTDSTNLSVISARPEDLAFMGGYLTMLIAWDWRAAGLLPTDSERAADNANAFENGARYVCGQCTPYYAPLVYFPLLAQESSQASSEAWGAQITTLGQNFVNSFFVDPSTTKPEVLDTLKNLEAVIYRDVKLVGVEGTVQPERFTALLGVDILPELQQVLPQLLAGKGGLVIQASVRIVSIADESVVTPAKVDDFNRVAADLAAGIIIPLSIP